MNAGSVRSAEDLLEWLDSMIDVLTRVHVLYFASKRRAQ